MVTADSFVTELDAKNHASIERLIGSLISGVAKEPFEVPDVMRLILKASIEAAEVAALWMADCDDLEMKLLLAEQCGEGAKQYRAISARLAQVDWMTTRFSGITDRNNIRYSGGLVLRF